MVLALILHTLPAPDAGPLTRLLASARAANADRLTASFGSDGATVHRVAVEPADDRPFGQRLAGLARAHASTGATRRPRPTGCVIAGSGAMPLARAADLRAFLEAAAGGRALANNRYSADIVAVPDLALLADLPALVEDNALPRWLAEVAGIPVDDLRGRWRLQVDLDSPLDLLLIGHATIDGPFAAVRDRLAAVARTLDDRRAEVLVAGRTSSHALRVLETRSAARIRAWVEERGMRASTPLALAPETARRTQRPPRSVLGLLLDREGPEAIGPLLAGLADAALVDTRVLLAHRLGVDERRWPGPEDRFASDLLLADRIGDPWLRALTASAASASIPIVLGGHTLVGPGSRLVLEHRRFARQPASRRRASSEERPHRRASSGDARRG